MLKYIFQYIRGTLDAGLNFKPISNPKLIGYSDADWASASDRHSAMGYCFLLSQNGPAISWKSKRQASTALSTCEAEYMALCAATTEAKFLDMLLSDFAPSFSLRPIKIYVDNTGAISLGKNCMVTKRSKHIDIRYHFTRQCYNDGLIDIVHVSTDKNVADVLTKPLGRPKFESFNKLLFCE